LFEHAFADSGARAGARARTRRRPISRPLAIGAAALMVTGLTILGGTVSAFAAANTSAPLTVTPSTGLSAGTMVAVTGSAYTPNSIGNLIECNNAPNEPTVQLGSPINSPLGVGCTAPSLTQLVQTDASGNIKAGTTFKVAAGTIGPPCGAAPAAVTCPATDSGNVSPTADAANYPCPPTPAQQAAGVTCVLNYGDAAGDAGVATLTFAGTTTPTSTPPTTAAPTATTKPPATTATTVAPATGASGGTTVTAAPAPVASTLASTGPGPAVGWLGAVGGVLLVLGLLLLLVLLDVPQRAWAGFVDRDGGAKPLREPADPGADRSASRLMAKAASSWTGPVNHAGHRLGDGFARVPGAARGITHRVVSVSTRTAAWLLGR
jgi:hypothetical protein